MDDSVQGDTRDIVPLAMKRTNMFPIKDTVIHSSQKVINNNGSAS